jgi:hypothetical protein
MQELCVGCHAPTVITKFRQSEAAWRLTVRDMVNRGLAGTPEQRELIVKYLGTHLGPLPNPSRDQSGVRRGTGLPLPPNSGGA